MKFSERQGFSTPRETFQLKNIDRALKNSIWNILNLHVLGPNQFKNRTQTEKYLVKSFYVFLWKDFFKEPIDNMSGVLDIEFLDMKDRFYKLSWYEIYDLVEFIAAHHHSDVFSEQINSVLKSEKSGYRLVDEKIVPITNEIEIGSIEKVVSQDKYSGCSAHIKRAMELYADRKSPDYRNSIKESISAIESITREITLDRKGGINNALTELEKKGVIHKALKSSLSSLYGYTSDENGIRHAILEEPRVSESDAKFMLITCSAFANYIIEKIAR
ncbi:AbiJ-NTD4 domain-containing protein [Marinobacter sp.]|uniref:AbiJ-NTD4 domain-containing protein n=1 Tax=Marinobacter sp. TaxID=50741 RepID=UPI003A9252F1